MPSVMYITDSGTTRDDGRRGYRGTSGSGLGRVKTLGGKRDSAPNDILRVRLCPDRCDERLNAYYVHHAGDVVGQHV